MEAIFQFDSLRSTVNHLRNELKECRGQVVELQTEFRSRVGTLTRFLRKMDSSNKENMLSQAHSFFPHPNFGPGTQHTVETQTPSSELLPRRWNSDLSLDQDGRSIGKHYQRAEMRSDLFPFCISTEAVLAPPIIRVPTAHQSKTSSGSKVVLKSKFTNRLDVVGTKRPADNLLLSDLGLTSQAPEFSQSEFNLSSDDHWLDGGHSTGAGKGAAGGRVRFLSHDDGQAVNLMANDDEDLDGIGNDLLMPHHGQHMFHSQSASWATLTHGSDRDLSEIESSAMSLNYQLESGDNNKPNFASSTPYKGLRSKFKQSVSFHDLLPSKATQSMPNLPPQPNSTAGETSTTRRSLALSSSKDRAERSSSPATKRHSLTSGEQRSQSFSSSTRRRSSLSGDLLEHGPYVPSAISSLFLGGRVKALHGGHLVVTGIVWYRGRLPGFNEDVVGIELDQVGLGGDGTFQGHRYFRCAPGRGLFVPFRKIIMAWPTRPPQ